MKILHIINSLATGGAEKLLLETLPLYNKAGITADLLVLNDTEYPFMKELKEQNCCAINALVTNSVYNPVAIFKIIPYLKKYDVIHVHLFPAQYWVVFAKILSFSNVKLIFTEHNTTNRRMNNFWFRNIDNYIYKKYTKIVCITHEIQDIITKTYNLNATKTIVIRNGVNLERIHNAKPLERRKLDYSSTNKDKIIIQVAGFRHQKDQQTLIKALQFLPKNIKLWLVGDGVTKEKCESILKKLHLEERVVFLGIRNDVPELLKTADIVVLSSKFEGLSLSSIEGMASGKPFVASDVPGLKEVVANAGVLFPVGDAKQLAEIILKLANDEGYYSTTVEACQKRAKEYDIHKMVAKHIALYRTYA